MELITDRTQADVDRVSELAVKLKANTASEAEIAEWNAGMKGAYNYADLNRVETAVAELAAELGIDLQTKTNWTVRDVPNHTDMTRYLLNIRAIRDVLGEYESTPATPDTMQKLNYTTANNIEKLLSDMYRIISYVIRSDEIYCGEV